jgi:hypothetical protein
MQRKERIRRIFVVLSCGGWGSFRAGAQAQDYVQDGVTPNPKK